MSRDFGAELDLLRAQMDELKQLVSQLNAAAGSSADVPFQSETGRRKADETLQADDELGAIFYSGQYRGINRYRWEPRHRAVSGLLGIDSDKAAKVLAALGHKQRLDILTAVLEEPLTGAEIVERLNMGTTGQLYHHTKALLGADLLVQEERGGRYSLPAHRFLPLLLLLAAASDLLDTSDYMELTETRNRTGAYLGTNPGEHDPHHLLRAVVENCLLEHQAGYCSEVSIILQHDGSITVADNGRGIPVQALPDSNKTPVQSVLTELSRYGVSASLVAPGGEKGIHMPVVNALSSKLSVEVRREGKVFRQDYRHGIPQSDLLVIGITKETGTSITFLPDRELFRSGFQADALEALNGELTSGYPGLSVNVHLIS
ncbi:ATP-binding protein [Paenibacillus harenae]|uniref:ATP-binding protein n=1 Tax=Paenibacillus harenae TaxID=306543 RepID=UPI000492E0F7